MLATKTALSAESKRKPDAKSLPAQATALGPRRLPHAVTSINEVPPAQAKPRDNAYSFQARVPVITGEATYRGPMPVDGVISGHLGASGSAMTIRQRPRNGPPESVPELDGDISFKDMVRVNGHIAGTVYSKTGTLIVDTEARVEASVDVAVAVIGGTVKGDIVARERVELGPSSKIYGNIWTRSIVIKNGAIFEGVCKMIEEAEIAS